MSVPLDYLGMLGDRVLIKPDRKPAQTESGLHLPETGYRPEQMGVVVLIGHDGHPCPGCGRVCESEVRVGDHVIFPPDVGQELQLNGEPYLVMREGDILAVIEGVA